VRLLLDTHAVVWWLLDEPHLSAAAKAAIEDPGNELLISAAVGYEIACKQRLGRLPQMPGDLSAELRRENMSVLPISLDHALAAAVLPGPHRDPWDRIMMAQARAEGCRVVTLDRVFSDYEIPVLW
jgi:PIN domain nuclease of toxin-antitoxin system